MFNRIFIAISDIHISLKNLEISMSVLEQALSLARKEKVDLVIAGDLNDTKAMMRSEWVKSLIDIFVNKYCDVHVHILVGNHDLNNKNSDNNSLHFLNLISNVTLYDDDKIVSIGGCKIGMIPYKPTSQAFIDSIRLMQSKEVKHIICHQGFAGAYMGDYAVDESSASPAEVKSFTTVLTGHYHKTQLIDNIRYFGSPFTVNFGEHLQEKFIWSADFQDTLTGGTIICSPIMTDARRHYQLVWDGKIPQPQESFSCENFYTSRKFGTNDLIKLVLRGTKEWIQSVTTEDMKRILHPCNNIIPVPDMVRQSDVRISSEIIHDPVKVIDSYLSTCKTDLDKSILREYLMVTCSDSINANRSSLGKFIKVMNVEAENFLSYQKFSFDYSSRGLTSVDGHDEDHDISTGAGKSAFLDAPSCGMFGVTSKDLKVDELINRKIGKNMSIKTTVATDAGIVRIERYRKHSTKENDLFMVMPDGKEVRGKDIKETQKKIEEFLGMDASAFFRSTYFSQFSAMDRFLSAPDSDKKKIIADISDTAIYDAMLEQVKKSLKDIDSKLSIKKNEKSNCEHQLETISRNLTLIMNSEDKWEQDQQIRLEALRKAAESFELNRNIEVENLKLKLKSFDDNKDLKISQLVEKKDQYDASEITQIDENNKKIESLNKTIEELSIKPEIPDVKSIDDMINAIDEKLKIIISLEHALSVEESEIRFEKSSIAKLRADIENYSRRKDQAKCSLCLQDISHSHIDLQIRAIENTIKINDSNIATRSKTRDQIQTSLSVKQELENKKSELKTSRYEIQSLMNSHQRNLDQAKRLYSDVENYRRSNLNRAANPYLMQIEVAKNEINPYIALISAKMSEANSSHDHIEFTKNQKNPHYYTRVNLTEQNESKTLEISNLKSVVDKLETLNSVALFWKDALHIYIKSYIIDSFLEQINSKANEVLHEMFDGILSIRIEATTDDGKIVKEKISVSIFNKNEECSYNSLSGGERCRICFALNLALSKTIKVNSGRCFNYIAFDEVLNGLDEVGKNQVMKILKQLESEYETVFVIDHTTEFKSMFSNSVLIRKSAGISSIVQ